MHRSGPKSARKGGRMAITLKAARVNAGFTQKEAANKLGVSQSTLSSYEKGRSFPDVPQIKAIEDLYGVSYSDLIFLQHGTI